MGLLLSGAPPLGVGAVLASLDIGGYLMGNDVAAMIASLLAALFGGLANALIGGLFNGST